MGKAIRRSVVSIGTDRKKEREILRVMISIEEANDFGKDPITLLLRREDRWTTRRSVRDWIQRNCAGWLKPRRSRGGKNLSQYDFTAIGEIAKKKLVSEYQGDEGFQKGSEYADRQTPADLPADLPSRIPPGLRISLERYRIRYPLQVDGPDHRDLPDPWTLDDSERAPRSWRKWILDLDGFSWRAEKTTRAVFVNVGKVIGSDPDKMIREAGRVAELVADHVVKAYGIPLGPGEIDRSPGMCHFEVHHPEFQRILDAMEISHLRIRDPATGQILSVDGSHPGPGIGGDSVEWVKGILEGPQKIQELQTQMGSIIQLLDAHGLALQKISENTQRMIELETADLISRGSRR